MIRKYIPVISDTVFFTFSVFLIFCSALLRLLPTAVAFTAAATVSLCFGVAVFKILSLKRKVRIKNEKETIDQSLYLTQLSFMNKTKVADLFYKAFVNSKKKFTRVKNSFRCDGENVLYSPIFNAGGAEKADVVKLYNILKKNERGKIFSFGVAENVKAFASRFGGRIEIISENKTYKFLKENGALPKIVFTPTENKIKFFDAAYIFNRKRAKKYFLFGSLFTVMSFFIKFGVYYIVAGCLFLSLAAATAVFGKTPQKEKV